MKIPGISRQQINLKPSFMLITVFLFIISAVAVTCSVRTLAETIIEQWAPRYIAKQALYDKIRTLQPIVREVALSRQLASSEFIKNWAKDPENPERTSGALAELENYRLNFQDQSYFVALLKNGHYYHNDASDQYSGKEYRYTLDPAKEADRWFYDLIRQKRDIHINVNPDVELGITKLWIDVLIRDGSEILGIAGTGLDLTSFLQNVVEEKDPGITSLFVDHEGAIQLYRDMDFIDFGSVSKKDGTHKAIGLIFDNEPDCRSIYAAMKSLETGAQSVATLFVQVHGKRQLAGIVYLPEIDWHEITLIDIGTLLPLSQFSMIIVVYILTLLLAMIIFNYVLNRFVLTPLGQLDRAMAQIESGKDPSGQLSLGGMGEIGRLVSRFLQMAEVVLASRRDLEQQVKDRTAALERLTKIDPLTELLNRRGMTGQIEMTMVRSAREDSRIGILWLDIDWFKEINDTYGHPAGGEALKSVSETIRKSIRPYDLAARWGGDEFLVMLYPSDTMTLEAVGERIRSSIEKESLSTEKGAISLSVSVGGSISLPGQEIDSLLHNADQALYMAKEASRNCCRFLLPGSDPDKP